MPDPLSRNAAHMRLRVAATMIALSVLVVSCTKDHVRPGVANVSDGTPTMRTVNVNTWVTDSGYMRYHITTPVWLAYDEGNEPHWLFPDTLLLKRFDNMGKQDASFRCDSAYYQSNNRLWRFDGHVRMTNVNGDLFLTEQIFWDQMRHKLYSDPFIHIETPERVLEGYGFESNEQITTYTINRPSGIFPVGDIGRRDSVHTSRPRPYAGSQAD